ncbi:MAG: hypothetical protein H6Q18_6 [Bacteroidetes bacterium]|nr:hypothetical protein [Bacteroidota bacterium]
MEHTKERLQSIDALRGFDMVWIMGAPWLVQALYVIFGGEILHNFHLQMEHVSWNGFHWMDLVFPLFLFISGMSFPYSLEHKRKKNESNKTILIELIRRAIILVVLGIIYNGFLKLNFNETRYASVLGHIGIAWFFASVIYLYTSKMYTLLFWFAGIIIVYGAINLIFISPFAISADHFIPENNIVCQFDRWFLPGILYNKIYDPEGILSIIPAISTALLGMITTRYMKEYMHLSFKVKTATYLTIGAALILLSLLVNLIIPINKALWSSSFVLLTGGISILLFFFFYWIIDVLKWRKWAFFFRVIGVNTILIYMAQSIINFYGISEFFLGGIASKVSKNGASLILSVGYIGACWLFLYFLYRKKIFLKV